VRWVLLSKTKTGKTKEENERGKRSTVKKHVLEKWTDRASSGGGEEETKEKRRRIGGLRNDGDLIGA